MNTALKMAKLDFFTLKGQLSNYLMIPILTLFFSSMGSSIITLSFTAAWFILIVNTNIFAIQEKNGLDRLYASLSIKQSNMILGRYIFVFSNFILAYFIALFTGIIVTAFKGQSITVQDTFIGFCVSCLMFSVVSAIQLPIFFKVGYTKGKMLSLVPFVAIMSLVLIIPSFVNVISFVFSFALKYAGNMSAISLVVSILVIAISYRVSVYYCNRQR